MKSKKALFMDFYGTVVAEISPIAREVIMDVYQNSSASSPREVIAYWYKTFGEKTILYNGPTFKTQHDMSLEIFRDMVRDFQCGCSPEALLARMEEHWCTSPIYEDAAAFLKQVSLPVYFVTNCDDRYVEAEIQKYGLHPAGVITSEQARYSKPHKELFLFAMEKAGYRPEDLVHIGDSLEGDVKTPSSLGIHSIWLNREKKEVPEGVESVEDLRELLKIAI